MMTHESGEAFERIAEELVSARGIARNERGSVLGENGTVRAMTSKGRVVVRLDPDRVLELVTRGLGDHYRGQANRWLVVDAGVPPRVLRRLILESLDS